MEANSALGKMHHGGWRMADFEQDLEDLRKALVKIAEKKFQAEAGNLKR